MKADPSFYKVDRDSFLETKPLRERLSCYYLDYDFPYPDFYMEANKYILRSFHNLFQYVTGEDSPSVIIDPETSQSFCSLTENKIQLGTIHFADGKHSQQFLVDGMYAVMLHEMWHKRYTNKDLKGIFGYDYFYGNPQAASWLKTILPSQVHVDVLNVLEDHRIERLGLRDFPGYVFYFDAIREYVIDFQQLKKVSLVSPAGLCIEYLMFKVLIPELLPWFVQQVRDLYSVITTKPPMTQDDLEQIWNKFDKYIADNQWQVYSDELSDLLKAVNALVEMIPKSVRDSHEQSKKKYAGTTSEFVFQIPEKGQNSDEYFDTMSELLSGLAEEAEKIAKNPDNKQPQDQKVRVEQINVMNVLEPHYRDVHIYSPVARQQDYVLINEAKTISKHISRDLGFMASRLNQIMQSFELTEGDLDEDELYSISYSKNIFYEDEPMPGYELDFGILLDESGSMSDDGKIRKAIAACLGIALACIGTQYINLFVYGHSNCRHNNGHYGVELYEYINTKRGIRDWKNILSAQGRGANADGYAIGKVGEIMIQDSSCKQKVLVVISDGYPMAYHYAGEPAEKHVRAVVDMLENKGVEIIQLCIDNIERSHYMFKNYIPFDPSGNFGKHLREIMQKKLQQFMESF